jgi:hypothetical protein
MTTVFDVPAKDLIDAVAKNYLRIAILLCLKQIGILEQGWIEKILPRKRIGGILDVPQF